MNTADIKTQEKKSITKSLRMSLCLDNNLVGISFMSVVVN